MSKKCCGMTYSDDETVCKVCGKTLPENSYDLNDILDDIKNNELAGDNNKIKDDDNQDDYDEDLEDEVTDVLKSKSDESVDDLDLDEEVTDVLKSGRNTEESEEDLDSEITDVLKRENDNLDLDKDAKNALNDIVEEKKNSDDDGRASGGLKFLGIISLLTAIAGLAIIGLGVYFLIVNPVFDKSNEDLDLNYPYIASSTDGTPATYDLATPSEEGPQ